MKKRVVVLAPLLLLVNLTAVSAPECPLPTTDEVREGFNRIMNSFFRSQESQPPADVNLYLYNFDCLAAGSTRGTYRSVAITGIFPRPRPAEQDYANRLNLQPRLCLGSLAELHKRDGAADRSTFNQLC